MSDASDPRTSGPSDPTTRLPHGTPPAPGPADRTEVMPGREVAPPPAAADRTQVLPGGDQRMVYTEDYSDRDAVGGQPGVGGGPGVGVPPGVPGTDPDEEGARTWPTLTLVLVSIAALLVGAVLTLLLLPEEEVVAADPAVAQLQADQQARIAELETTVAERDARIAELEAQVAAVEAQQAGDQAAADQAAADRQAALDAREQALEDREATVAAREDQVAQREQQVAEREAAADAGTTPDGDQAADGGGGFDLPTVEVPADLPQIDEEAARSVIERFIDRLQSFFG